MTRYRLTLEAEGDLDDISLHLLEQGGAKLARYGLSDIRKALRFLREIQRLVTLVRTSRPSR